LFFVVLPLCLGIIPGVIRGTLYLFSGSKCHISGRAGLTAIFISAIFDPAGTNFNLSFLAIKFSLLY